MASCTNEAMVEDVQTSGLNVTTRSIIDPVGIQEVAELMSVVDIDDAIMQEVKTGVERSVKYGMGETFRFNDILKPEESKLIRTMKVTHSLSNELRKAYSSIKSAEKIKLADVEFFTELANGNLIIRWPYFQNWNGMDKPIIGFASEDGYTLYKPVQQKDGTFFIEEKKVTDEYIKENPIWVIAESDLSYDEIPDFENGEFYNKDSVFFYSKYAVEEMNKSTRTAKLGLYIANMMFKEHYEGLQGGGDFEFYWQSVPNGVATSKKILRYSSNGRLDEEIQIDFQIKSDWDINELSNGLVILEKDGGLNKTGKQVLKYDAYRIPPLEIEVSYPYERKDEFILNYVFPRESLCDKQNNTAVDGSLKKYYGKNNNFWITFNYF